MILTNVNGTSQSTCPCGSWLSHWQRFSGQTIRFCPVVNCIRTDLVGAHVQLAGLQNPRWYICPLCTAHNNSNGLLYVSDDVKLVSANKTETCERGQQSSYYSPYLGRR